jgi:hypothetical protein
MLPGLAVRPIRWTAVRSVRGVCCNPTPQRPATARNYVLFEVEAPETFVAGQRSRIRRLAAPQPPGAPPITLDLGELDAGERAIVEAVRRFHPAAVADAASDQPAGTTYANEASIRMPSMRELKVHADRIRIEAALLIARRTKLRSAAVAARRDLASRVQAFTVASPIAVGAAVVALRQRALSVRGYFAASAMRLVETLRAAIYGIRHRFERGL